LRLKLRIEWGEDIAIGPGKADLLEGIQKTGSIAAAGRKMGMSYKRAWYLIDTLNRDFRAPVVTATKGGKLGGGARLTPLGEELLRRYRHVQEVCAVQAAGDLFALSKLAARQGR